MTRAGRRAAEDYPDKRLIVHYLQPHYPFVGQVGRREIGEQAGVEWTRRRAMDETPRRYHEFTAWEQLVVEYGTRREVVAEPPDGPSGADDRETAAERLGALGYRE